MQGGVGLPESGGRRPPPRSGTIGEAIASGKPVLRRDFAATEQPRADRELRDLRRGDGSADPFVRGDPGRPRRLLARRTDRFDDSDLRLIEAFASLASVALRNAEAYEESTRQARVERGFYRIASVLSEPLSAAATLDAVAQAAAEALGGGSAAVLRSDGDALQLAGAHGLDGGLADYLGRRPQR